MKYLIIKCDELGDQWECDANRTPICMTDDYSKYGYGYEVYGLKSGNTFELIKEYDKSLEKGIAIYDYSNDILNEVFEKHKNLSRWHINKTQVKKWKAKYHFHDTVQEIFSDIEGAGSHGEEINGKWVVIGEYIDNSYECGY